MFYSVDGKIVEVGGAFTERRVNTLSFVTDGDRFPNYTNNNLGFFSFSFFSPISFTINYGDGNTEIIENVSGYSLRSSDGDFYLYQDGNTGDRVVTFEFEDIKQLQVVNSQFCNLKGTFPVEVGAAVNLEDINLRSTNFDSFPTSLFDLRNLRLVILRQALSFKFLTIPDAIFSNAIEVLSLEDSFDLEDHIKSGFFKINQLKNTLINLNVQRCNLRGLPEEIRELQLLEVFTSLFNDFDALPPQIESLPKLDRLEIGNLPPRFVDDPTMLDFSNQNLVKILALRISNLDFSEISIKWEGLKSLEIINLFGDMVTTDARFDEFIDQFYTLTINNAYLNPATAPVEEEFPNQFRNVTWGASTLTPTGDVQAPSVSGNPQNQGEKIHELINKYNHNIIFLNTNIKYVRPAGTTYGTGDGSSYENAWSGFNSIVWSELENKTLAVCGTHLEELNVQQNNVTIVGNNQNEAGLIDGELSRASCIHVNSFNNVTINNLELQRGLVQCLFVRGTSQNCITNDCEFSNSGNQGIQHYDSCTATHNNPLCVNNVDDGISLHDSTTVVVNGGVMNGNDQQINTIENSICTVNETEFINGITYDIFSTAATTEGSCEITVNNCNLGVVKITNGSNAIFNNCEIQDGQFERTGLLSEVELNNSYSINNNFRNNKIKSINSKLLNCNVGVAHDFDFSKSYIEPNGAYRITSGLSNFENCLIDLNKNTNTIALDVDGGNLQVFNSVLVNNTSNNFYVGLANKVSSSLVFNGNNVIGVNNTTRGLINFKTNPLEINNNIFTNNSVALLGSQQINANNCLFHNNNTNTQQNVTLIDEVIGDPLFTDEVNLDFRLNINSPAIASGTITDNSLAIQSADWNANPSDVITLTQIPPFNIGAYKNQ